MFNSPTDYNIELISHAGFKLIFFPRQTINAFIPHLTGTTEKVSPNTILHCCCRILLFVLVSIKPTRLLVEMSLRAVRESIKVSQLRGWSTVHKASMTSTL